MHLMVIQVRRDGFDGGSHKQVDNVGRLLARKGGPTSEDVFKDCFEGMFDLVKDVQFGVRGFLEHRERVLNDKAEMHGYDME